MGTRNPTRMVQWSMTLATHARLEEILRDLGEVTEESDEYQALKDQIQSLPNFPPGFDPLNTHFFTEITSKSVTPTGVTVH